MCGILGASFSLSNQFMNKALMTMQHRGSDEINHYIDSRVAMGHVRLSIIGLEEVKYPIFNENETVCVVVNGEFYQHKRIKEELIKKGHRFKTNTDAEILVHLYEEYGEKCVEHLIGEFAFLVYDKRKNILLAGRDRFGVKPLYFCKHEGEFFFSSEMKALKQLGIPFEFDKENLLISSAMQYTPQDKTIVKGVEQVVAGFIYRIDLETKQLSKIKYWDIDFKERSVDLEELQKTLVNSVEERLTSDVPVCCALSGGLDSSFVFGVANQIKKTDGVTVEFENQEFNESEIAQRTTDYFGSNLHKVLLKSEHIVEHFSESVYFSEGLTVNSHLVGKFLLSDLIQKNGFKVVLTGEGSDELFGGYPHFKKDLQIHYQNFEQENLISKGIMNTSEKEHSYVQGYLNEIGYVPDFLRVKSVFGKKVLNMFNKDYLNDFDFNQIPKKVLDNMNIQNLKSYDRANASAYIWTKIVLTNYILRTLADGTEMAHTVEGRTPFLDHRLWDIAGGISISEKIKGTIEKKILRDLAKPYITEEVYHKTKQPFITPPLLLKQKDFLYDHLNTMPDFIDKEILQKTLNTIYKGDTEAPEYEAVLYFIYSIMFFENHFIKRGV